MDCFGPLRYTPPLTRPGSGSSDSFVPILFRSLSSIVLGKLGETY